MVCLMGMCSGDELHAESFCDEVNMCHGEGQPVLPILIPRFPSDRLRWFLGVSIDLRAWPFLFTECVRD